MAVVKVESKEIKVNNPEKELWPGLTKMDYIKIIMELSEYIIPYTKDRLLTTIRYPDGIKGKSFFQKNIPSYAPDWLNTVTWKDNEYINLNSSAAIIWLAGQAALEYHIPFNLISQPDSPSHLVFDLDPSKGQNFDDVIKGAQLINEELIKLEIDSLIKTSGASGMQVYIDIDSRFNYETARKINKFFGVYFSKKYPDIFTIERIKDKRGKRIYFDYLQMWEGKTIIAPYSPRANEDACVSTPIKWDEVKEGLSPNDYTLFNIKERLRDLGDIFSCKNANKNYNNLKKILGEIR